MAKPILIIHFPMEDVNTDKVKDIGGRVMEAIDNEYHVLIFVEDSRELSFECINSDNATELDIEALQKLVEDSIKHGVCVL